MALNGSNLRPYAGNESYIFISYAPQNRDEVLEIIGQMQAEGFRVWYNEGRNPDAEWAEHLAERVIGCGYFIAFISQEYLASESCLDELNYARDKEKDRLLVYLSNVTLPDGIGMRVNRLQAIHKYVYGQEEFYEHLFQAKGLRNCMISSASGPECVSPHAADSFPNTEEKIPDSRTGQDTVEGTSSAAHFGKAKGKRRKLLLVPIVICIPLILLIPFLFPNRGTDKEAPIPGSADLGGTNDEAPSDPASSPILDPNDLNGLSFGMSPGEVRESMAALGATETDTEYTSSGILLVQYDPGTMKFNGSDVDALSAEFGSDGLYAFHYRLAAHQSDETIQTLKNKYGKPIRPYIVYDEWDLEGGITLTYVYEQEEEGDNVWFVIPYEPYFDMRDFTWGMSPEEAQNAERGRSDSLTLTKTETNSDGYPHQYYEGEWKLHGNTVNKATLVYISDQLIALRYILPGASLDSVASDLEDLYGEGEDMKKDGSTFRWQIMMAQPDASGEIRIVLAASRTEGGVLMTLLDADRYRILTGK